MISARHREQFEKRSTDFVAQTERRFRSHKKFHISQNHSGPCSPDNNTVSLEDNQLSESALFHMGNVDDSIDDIFNRAAESVSSRIVMDKRVYGGAPCVAGTRVPVYAILELMEAGFSHKKILKSFPAVGQGGLEAALRFVTHVMEK